MATDHSLELSKEALDDDGRKARTGTMWTCIAYVIASVIGSGVLALAWSTAQLGWIGGPATMVGFAIVTYISAHLLSDCYRSPHPVTGKRNQTYMDAVRVNLGEEHTWICGLLQYLSLYGTGIAYTVTTSISIRAIMRSNCYHKEGHNAPCAYGTDVYMIVFGCLQVVLSQIPDFHDMEWLSIVAAAMSFCYSSIGLGLGFAKVIGNKRIKGNIEGATMATTAQKFCLIGSIKTCEIQKDTLKSKPAENKVMKKASVISVSLTTFFYMCCGCFGYAAFGDQTPGNIMTGFGFYEPYWLIDFANACVVLHLLGGYQVFNQPIFGFIDRWFVNKYPNNGFVNDFHTIKLPLLPPYRLNLLRLCYRTLYVVSTTVIAITFPYFNQVLGVLGALNFWPLAIYFPVEMYFVQMKIQHWTKKWLLLQAFSMICLIISTFALVGSVEGIISEKFK
ncbi:putative amino acid permease 7 [Acorus calamus]|uniref:Amino acid permease 7 n=1 Tax=Acorus calamus TaxID=4465 RepID=A0AAV9CWB2_ACOCL|nr:putative amino acid permease 7 [Acorus calamus]